MIDLDQLCVDIDIDPKGVKADAIRSALEQAVSQRPNPRKEERGTPATAEKHAPECLWHNTHEIGDCDCRGVFAPRKYHKGKWINRPPKPIVASQGQEPQEWTPEMVKAMWENKPSGRSACRHIADAHNATLQRKTASRGGQPQEKK